ncbi:hypothetical protein HYE68_002964 [Fusarium pseudograminearum]|nr:hypothetical protein HYE68_002964 [Fusarium pseudograminearum]
METPNRSCTYSFGDNGTTATHFRGEKVGYCVDHPSIPQPYEVVDRITTFLSTANDPDHNIGFYPDLAWLGNGVDSASATFIDNRWPLFTVGGSSGKFEIQYCIFKGVVYQTFLFGGAKPPMGLKTNFLIRQLEFADRDNVFNKAEENDDCYNTELSSPGLHHIKRWHDKEENSQHVALFISAYLGKSAISFVEDFLYSGENEGVEDESQAHCMVWPESTVTAKITFVYSLELINDKSIKSPTNTVHIPIPWRLPDQPIPDNPCFTGLPHLNRLLSRNLEHILSVCSIPVYTDTSDETDHPAIALTCGDVENHRVATAASFYCFQLLLLALKHFESLPLHSEGTCADVQRCYTCSMVRRIRKVLNGHLKWIFGREYRDLADNITCLHTWVNGKEIAGWEKSPYFPDSLVDVPFHLIKAGDFYGYDTSNEFCHAIGEACNVPVTAGEAIKAWVRDLDTKNKLGYYAFPRNIKAPIHQFYFTDHVLIWRAIKAAEALGLKDNLFVTRMADQNIGEAHSKKSPVRRYYSSSIVRSQILTRFTVENPISKKRMLSVSRSPSHIRFLFRNKDATLFHAMDSGLFDKPGATSATAKDVWSNKLDVWKNLVDCQRLHEENDDTTWDEPLRFALSMIMAHKGKPINSLSPKEMHGRAASVLINSVWPNGLFSGQLDFDNEPTIYTDEWKRDTYWGWTFEIPYIIWKYAQPPDEPTIADVSGEPQSSPMSTLDPEFWISLRALIENQCDRYATSEIKSHPMKFSFPWNSPVNQTNIAQLSDEWLYTLPDFFKDYDDDGIGVGDLEEAFQRRIKPSGVDYRPISTNLRGVVVNVPRSKARKKIPPRLEDLCKVANDWDFLTSLIKQRRLTNTSKKRFYAAFAPRPEQQRPYPQIREESEAMLNFFSKHISYDKSFFEYATLEKNRWTTEFHLSFYSLCWRGYLRHPHDFVIDTSSTSKRLDGMVLAKVAMGCRFDGDLFDRYWTVYFLESDPKTELNTPNVESIVANMLRNRREKGDIDFTTLDVDALEDNKEPWRQRRILELLLFQRMVDEMRKNSFKILDYTKSNVWKLLTKEERPSATLYTEGLLRTTNAEPGRIYSFHKVSQRCQLYQHILQIVEQDLVENLAKIELWMDREQERQNEPPRWTFNDEIRYRTIISKMLIQNNHSVQALRHTHANISQFKEMLTIELERMSNEMNRRREDNIKRFTYVTVIFLPLSFGTGVFSMSDAPSGQTLQSMIKTSAVAFVATALLLVFSEQLELLFRFTKNVFYHSSRPLSKFYHDMAWVKREAVEEPPIGPGTSHGEWERAEV